MVRVLDSADVGPLVSMAEAFAAADRGGEVTPALLKVRPIEQVTVWGRRQPAEQYQRGMAAAGVPVRTAGIQDAAVAALVARLVDEHGAGRDAPLGDW